MALTYVIHQNKKYPCQAYYSETVLKDNFNIIV